MSRLVTRRTGVALSHCTVRANPIAGVSPSPACFATPGVSHLETLSAGM